MTEGDRSPAFERPPANQTFTTVTSKANHHKSPTVNVRSSVSLAFASVMLNMLAVDRLELDSLQRPAQSNQSQGDKRWPKFDRTQLDS